MSAILDVFLELVKLSSPSGHEEPVAVYIKNYVKKYPELEVNEDDIGNVLVHLKGEGPHLLFDAHMDTVSPCEHITPVIDNGVVRTDGTTVLGGDDKSGVALMLVLLDYLMIQETSHPEITFLFTVQEETSLKGAKALQDKYLSDVDFAYVLDGEGPIGTAIVKTPYGCKGKLIVRGKEAHAGVCPEKGINALVVAAQAITRLKIGRVSNDTTCNIGIIQGGTATNVVMGEVEMNFEARSYDRKKLEKLIETVRKTFEVVCTENGADFEDNLTYGTPGYQIADDEPVLTYFKNSCTYTGTQYRAEACGGGSNANVYRMRGVDAVNLSTNMQNVHSVDESLEVKDLEEMLQLVECLVSKVAE